VLPSRSAINYCSRTAAGVSSITRLFDRLSGLQIFLIPLLNGCMQTLYRGNILVEWSMIILEVQRRYFSNKFDSTHQQTHIPRDISLPVSLTPDKDTISLARQPTIMQPSSEKTATTIESKAQPWKAFMTVNETNTIDENEKREGAVRLRVEADDKGGLGG